MYLILFKILLILGKCCGSNEYFEYIPGNINLIFSVPHNGDVKPDHIPTRKPGCKNSKGLCEFPGPESCSKSKVCKVATLGDAHTQDIARAVVGEFVAKTGTNPHLIISNIHRSKMDPNRPIDDSAQGNSDAEEAYNAYHNKIKEVIDGFGGNPGLLIDIHGQGHKKNSTEIGYLIKKAALNSGKFGNSEIGIESLVKRKNVKLDDFIFGAESLGALFEAAGYKAVPSPRQKSPGTDLYFRGGYTAQVHGSRDGGVVDAIQLEIPGEIRMEGGNLLRQQFSLSLANIIDEFFSKNYFEYFEYIQGNINLIFSVPHNGYEKPEHMPTREPGCENIKGVCKYPGPKNCRKAKVCEVATLGDAYTKEMARAVFDAFVSKTGMTPHLIISNIHRSKMDPNRPIDDAAQGNNEAIEGHNAYHNKIMDIKTSFGGNPGLLIDIHGQSHKKNSTEIGYLIKKAALNSGKFGNNELSIKSLVGRKNAKLDDYIFGTNSLGALFEAAGYKAVPSPRQKSPGTDLYFRGGYTTQVHGSRDGGVVDAIQLEFPGEIRIDGGQGLRQQFSTELANIIEKYFSTNYIKYFEYIPGNINLIFSVPHNGYDKPDHMPTRKPGCENSKGVCEFPGSKSCSKTKVCEVATLGDAHTQEIARAVFDAFVAKTGKTPHLIINNIHRSRMDPNRPIDDAAQGNTEAKEAHKAYHNKIVEVKKQFGGSPGLLIDIHGQGHKKNSTEIGYLIKKAALNSGKFGNSKLSIKSLVQRKNAKLDDYIFGTKSLGALFEAAGYKAVPSPRQKSPGKDLYYRGGYTTQVHGSRDGGVVDAIQLEFPGEIRIEGGKEFRDQFSTELAKIIHQYFNINY